MKTIIALSGSLRQKSVNTHLLEQAAKVVPAGYEIEIASVIDIPLYNQDIEDEYGIPTAVQQLKEKIANSSGLLISTPEFNHSIPGVLKNTIDWLSRPREDIPKVFGKLPTGIIGAGSSHFGTVFAQAAWLPILQLFNVRPYFERSLYIGSSYEAFDQEGKIMDETLQKRLQDYIEGFAKFIKEFRGSSQ